MPLGTGLGQIGVDREGPGVAGGGAGVGRTKRQALPFRGQWL